MWGQLRQECWLLSVADPHIIRFEVNPIIVPHQREVIVAIARMHHQIMSDGHLPRREDPQHLAHGYDRSFDKGKVPMQVATHTHMSTKGCITHRSGSTNLKGGRAAKTHGWLVIKVGRPAAHLHRWAASSSGDVLGHIEYLIQVA
jgi:hypothetical protein